jgi:hypothetical protein
VPSRTRNRRKHCSADTDHARHILFHGHDKFPTLGTLLNLHRGVFDDFAERRPICQPERSGIEFDLDRSGWCRAPDGQVDFIARPKRWSWTASEREKAWVTGSQPASRMARLAGSYLSHSALCSGLLYQE